MIDRSVRRSVGQSVGRSDGRSGDRSVAQASREDHQLVRPGFL